MRGSQRSDVGQVAKKAWTAWLGLGLALALLGLPSPALAASEAELAAARTAFSEGVRAQEEGRFRTALDHYADVRRIVVSPQLLFNIATCRERINELVEAIEAYQAALALAREKARPEVVTAAATRIAALEKEIPRLIVRLSPQTQGAEVTFDGTRVESGALESIRANPGIHRLVIWSDAHAERSAQAIALTRQEVREIEVDLGPLVLELPARPRAEPPRELAADQPMPPPQARPRSEGRTYLPAIVASGVTLALAGAALGTGLAGKADRDRFDDLNAHPSAENRAERAELRSEGTALYTANAVLSVGTVLAAGVTTYLFLRPPKTARWAERTSIFRALASIPVGMRF